MLHYIIADDDLKYYYNEGSDAQLEYISQKYPTIYASEKEAQAIFNSLDADLLSVGDLKVQPVKLVRQTF